LTINRPDTFSNREDLEKVVNLYSVGKKTFCFVNPQKPADALINSAFDFRILWEVWPVSIFIILGIIIFIISFRASRDPKTIFEHSLLPGCRDTHKNQ